MIRCPSCNRDIPRRIGGFRCVRCSVVVHQFFAGWRWAVVEGSALGDLKFLSGWKKLGESR